MAKKSNLLSALKGLQKGTMSPDDSEMMSEAPTSMPMWQNVVKGANKNQSKNKGSKTVKKNGLQNKKNQKKGWK